MTDNSQLWRRSSHLVATRTWAKSVFGADNIGSLFSGDEWLPEIWNELDRHFVRLKRGATRMQFLLVWNAIGGKSFDPAVLNNASKEDRK